MLQMAMRCKQNTDLGWTSKNVQFSSACSSDTYTGKYYEGTRMNPMLLRC